MRRPRRVPGDARIRKLSNLRGIFHINVACRKLNQYPLTHLDQSVGVLPAGTHFDEGPTDLFRGNL
jgi:hypothetical protein